MASDESQRLIRYIEIIEAELHQCQERQRLLISALEKARAELYAINSGGVVYFDGEKLVCG